MSILLGSGAKAASGDLDTGEAVMFMAVEDSIPLSAGYQRSGPPRGALNPDLPIKGRDLFQYHTSPNPADNELITIELLQGALGEADPLTAWTQVACLGVHTGDDDPVTITYLAADGAFFGSTENPLRDRWSFEVPTGTPMLIDGLTYVIVFEWNV